MITYLSGSVISVGVLRAVRALTRVSLSVAAFSPRSSLSPPLSLSRSLPVLFVSVHLERGASLGKSAGDRRPLIASLVIKWHACSPWPRTISKRGLEIRWRRVARINRGIGGWTAGGSVDFTAWSRGPSATDKRLERRTVIDLMAR